MVVLFWVWLVLRDFGTLWVSGVRVVVGTDCWFLVGFLRIFLIWYLCFYMFEGRSWTLVFTGWWKVICAGDLRICVLDCYGWICLVGFKCLILGRHVVLLWLGLVFALGGSLIVCWGFVGGLWFWKRLWVVIAFCFAFVELYICVVVYGCVLCDFLVWLNFHFDFGSRAR